MTRTVIAVAALALAARASATNGPKPKEISVKAAGKNSCEICPAGSAVKIDAVAMYTGDAWAGVVFFVRRALQLQGRLYRAPPRPNSS